MRSFFLQFTSANYKGVEFVGSVEHNLPLSSFAITSSEAYVSKMWMKSWLYFVNNPSFLFSFCDFGFNDSLFVSAIASVIAAARKLQKVWLDSTHIAAPSWMALLLYEILNTEKSQWPTQDPLSRTAAISFIPAVISLILKHFWPIFIIHLLFVRQSVFTVIQRSLDISHLPDGVSPIFFLFYVAYSFATAHQRFFWQLLRVAFSAISKHPNFYEICRL